jgi:glyoxylase-like metal-dependent hydrolase (beta-lactamase superfamily II)
MVEKRLHIESTTKPWFGPRARAKAQLAQFVGQQSSHAQFIEVFSTYLGKSSLFLRGIRFIKFRNQADGFEFSIALCWMGSCQTSRQLVYDISQEIVSLTGWYPLVAGDRLGSRSTARKASPAVIVPQDCGSQPSSEMVSFESAVPSDGGCAIRIKMRNGNSFLLDAGLPDQLQISETDKFLLLSHTHLDHFGGLLQSNLPDLEVYVSPATFRILSLRQPKWIEQNSDRVRLVSPGTSVDAGNGIQISNFSVPHCAGSTGWKVCDSRSEVVYSGDISIRTGRHNFLPKLAQMFSPDGQNEKILFLDATMAGRDFGAANDAIGVLELSNGSRPLVIIASEIDHLMYAYLDLYFQTMGGENRNQISFVMSSRAKETFTAVHNDYLVDRDMRLDPFIEGQFGSKRSAWGESRSLYWLDELASSIQGAVIYFVTPQDFASSRLPTVANAVKIAGRLSDSLYIPSEWEWIDGIDTSTWTSHSNSKTLVESIGWMTRNQIQVILFHNFSNRLKRFVSEHNLKARAVRTSGQELLVVQ